MEKNNAGGELTENEWKALRRLDATITWYTNVKSRLTRPERVAWVRDHMIGMLAEHLEQLVQVCYKRPSFGEVCVAKMHEFMAEPELHDQVAELLARLTVT